MIMLKYIPQWFISFRLTTLFLLANLLAVAALAQVKISGKVTGQDGNGLPGITISVQNTNFGTASDVNGNYTLTADLKAGNYTLVFTGIGYKSSESSLRITNNSNYTLNAQLSSDALGLDEVIVTGTSAGTTRRQLGSYISTVK